MPMPHDVATVPKFTDKLVHIVIYVLFTMLWFAFFYYLNTKTEEFLNPVLKSCGFAIIYGIVIEVLQAVLTTSRSADFNDFLANLLGISIGILLIFSLKSLLKSLKTRF